ncbi:hypothetical protein [Streptomyces caelestis]
MAEHREAGLASGVVNTFHEVGGPIGVAVVALGLVPRGKPQSTGGPHTH